MFAVRTEYWDKARTGQSQWDNSSASIWWGGGKNPSREMILDRQEFVKTLDVNDGFVS